MKSFVIEKNDSGRRLDRFVSKVCPKMPTALICKYVRLKRIKVNGSRTEIGYRLNGGDTVDLYVNDEFFEKTENYDFLAAGNELNIVYEDSNILIADKPTGLLCHPDKNEYTDTLISRIIKYLYNKGEYSPKEENTFKPALANRIDRNTGGLVIAAKTAAALRILCEKIKNREIDKRYLCIVKGVPKEKTALLTGYLKKDESKNQVFLSQKDGFGKKEIKTRYKVLKSAGGLSLLEIELLTGRTHQIRAQMAAAGYPLLGDRKYGDGADKKTGLKNQALYSYKLSFFFDSPAGELDYLNAKTFKANAVPFVKEIFGEIKY